MRDLEHKNRELESFSYAVSHDLRAPLRRIDSFSRAVLESQGERLDEAGRRFLSRVREASQHMSQLIDDVLYLSRVTRADLREQDVDLSAIASADPHPAPGERAGAQGRAEDPARRGGHRGWPAAADRAGESAGERLEVHRQAGRSRGSSSG